MSKEPSGPISPYDGNILTGISNQVRLILRLLADGRVNPLAKLLPIGSVVYLLVPDLIVGPIDDATLMLLAGYFFVELCPPDVVEEHKRRLGMPVDGVINTRPEAGANPPSGEKNNPDIIDAEYTEKRDST